MVVIWSLNEVMSIERNSLFPHSVFSTLRQQLLSLRSHCGNLSYIYFEVAKGDYSNENLLCKYIIRPVDIWGKS